MKPSRLVVGAKDDARTPARSPKRRDASQGDEAGGRASLNPRTVPDVVYETVAMSRRDHDLIVRLRVRLTQLRRPTGMDELVSAGLDVLASMPDDHLLATLADLPPVEQVSGETMRHRRQRA